MATHHITLYCTTIDLHTLLPYHNHNSNNNNNNNMTVLTESTKKRSETLKKRIPVKRTVSFSKVNIYHTHVTDSDDVLLQSRDKRRRYQRRGSKTPAMLLLSKTDLSKIQSKYFPNDMAPSENTATNATITNSSSLDDYSYYPNTHFNDTNSSIQQRRMSIISSLRESLELNCSMFGGGSSSSEPTKTAAVTTTPTTISTNASVIRRRRLSFDLTMQAATTVCTTPWNL